MNQKSNHKVWLVFARVLGMETKQERHQLDEIVVPDSKEKLLLDEMSSGEDYLRRRQMIEDIDVDRELERVMRPRRRRLPVLLGRVAAVLLPLLLGGTAIYVMYSKNNASLKNVISLHDVEPGTLEAVLVTSDGTLRELQTAGNHINEKDGSKIMVDSARLNYQDNRPESVRELIYNKLLVGRGHEYMLILNDGTRVWMNARSRLVYPVAFGDTREVELEGEAYFEVTRDENRPFIVHAGQVAVKVLGTEFNVNTCRKQKVQTVLVKGSVQVENGGKREVVLRPGELAETVGTQIRVTQVNVRKYTAWREGVFYFEEADLEEIMTELADWYCVQAVFTDQTVRTRKFSGVLERSETIENVLKKIERTTSVHFTIQQGIIQVK